MFIYIFHEHNKAIKPGESPQPKITQLKLNTSCLKISRKLKVSN